MLHMYPKQAGDRACRVVRLRSSCWCARASNADMCRARSCCCLPVALLPLRACLQVRQDIDHRSYMPAAWRVDEYLNQEEEDDEEWDLASLKKHK